MKLEYPGAALVCGMEMETRMRVGMVRHACMWGWSQESNEAVHALSCCMFMKDGIPMVVDPSGSAGACLPSDQGTTLSFIGC